LHALIDIGAGTLDFTTFNVWRIDSGDDVFPIFARAVKPFGTRLLIEQRLKQRLNGAERRTSWRPSPFEDVPSDAEFCHKLSLSAQQLRDIDQHVWTSVADVICDRLRYTKERRTPLSPNWNTGVPTFLCGGGARVPCYLDIFRGFIAVPEWVDNASRFLAPRIKHNQAGAVLNPIWKRYKQGRPPYRLAPTTLTVPDNLLAPDLPRHAYDRLSVAYGLSYIPDDIGRILRMEETKDFTEAEARQSSGHKDYRDRYIDKDMM
jgi:hypothetical protein